MYYYVKHVSSKPQDSSPKFCTLDERNLTDNSMYMWCVLCVLRYFKVVYYCLKGGTIYIFYGKCVLWLQRDTLCAYLLCSFIKIIYQKWHLTISSNRQGVTSCLMAILFILVHQRDMTQNIFESMEYKTQPFLYPCHLHKE